MIRKLEFDELETVMKIWLKSNIAAHNFIPKDYWLGNYGMVKKMLPDAIVFVYEENNVIMGFIGLIENYIAGIFIDANNQSKGTGKALLDYVKKTHSELSLEVYKKNPRAVKFYLREGFAVTNEKTDENTGESELTMNWIN